MPQPSSSLFEDPAPNLLKFPTRRSVVHSTEGIVACSQPLAAKCGLEILHAGGNAAVGTWPCCVSHLIFAEADLVSRTRPWQSVGLLTPSAPVCIGFS